MVDTEMQATARNTTNDFPLKILFEEAKKNGKLKKSSDIASKIIKNYITKRFVKQKKR